MKQTLFAIVHMAYIPEQDACATHTQFDGTATFNGVKYCYDRYIHNAYSSVYDARNRLNDICERHYDQQQLERTQNSAKYRSYSSGCVSCYNIEEIEVEF